MSGLNESLAVVLDLVKGMWLKKRYVMLATWIIAPVGMVVVHELPDTYQSSAIVYVDTDSLLQPILEGLTVQSDIEERIQVMVSTLKSRPNLEKIARQTDLDVTAKTPEEYERLIESLKNNIGIRQTGRPNLYNIEFTAKTAATSRAVVQTVLNTFVENMLGENRVDTDNVRVFLDEQIADYEARLSEDEMQLATFRQENAEYLFVNEGGIYAQISELRNANKELELQINTTKAQLEEKRALLDQIRNTSNETELNSKYDEDIAQLQEQLSNLSLRFTERHPEIQQIKTLISNLEERRKQELSQLQEQLQKEESSPNAGAISGNEAIIELQQDIATLQSSVTSLEEQKIFQNETMTELNSKLDIIPLVDARLTALNRDYSITKTRYEELLNRKESAVISRRADMSNSDVQFRVIEPPQLPTSPYGPQRLLFYTAVLVLSFGVGVGLTFLISQINPVVHSTSSLRNISDIPVFGCVSDLNYKQVNRKNKIKIIYFILSSSAIFLIYAVFIADELGVIELSLSGIRGLL